MLHNYVLVRGMPHTRPGLRRLNGVLTGDGDRTVYGLAIWRGSPDELIIASGSKLEKLPLHGGDPTALTESFPTSFRSSPTGARTVFAQLGGRLFIVNGTDANIKYNGTNLTRMGLEAPTSLSSPSTSSGSLPADRCGGALWETRGPLTQPHLAKRGCKKADNGQGWDQEFTASGVGEKRP